MGFCLVLGHSDPLLGHMVDCGMFPFDPWEWATSCEFGSVISLPFGLFSLRHHHIGDFGILPNWHSFFFHPVFSSPLLVISLSAYR
jgi:hypothetical protein